MAVRKVPKCSSRISGWGRRARALGGICYRASAGSLDSGPVGRLRLHEVVVGGVPRRILRAGRTRERKPLLVRRSARARAVGAVGRVVLGTAAVVVEPHGTVAAVVARAAQDSLGLVHGQAGMVYAQPVALGVAVREQAGLEHAVRRGTDARH